MHAFHYSFTDLAEFLDVCESLQSSESNDKKHYTQSFWTEARVTITAWVLRALTWPQILPGEYDRPVLTFMRTQ
jgi:hypothetical protein